MGTKLEEDQKDLYQKYSEYNLYVITFGQSQQFSKKEICEFWDSKFNNELILRYFYHK